MKNFVKCRDDKNDVDIILLNLDRSTGRIAFALMLVGAIATYRTVKNVFTSFKKETEQNEQN